MDRNSEVIPFRLDDEPAQEGGDPPRFDDIGITSIGHVATRSGVEIVAVDGRHDEAVAHDMTSMGWVFHAYITPPTATLTIDSRREMPMPRFVFLPPGTPIQWRSSPSINTACLFGPDFVASLSDRDSALGFDALDVVLTQESARLADLAKRIMTEAASPGFGSGLLAEAIATQIALEIVRCDRAHRPGETPLRGGLALWQKRRLESYVRANLSEDLTLDQLGALLGMSTRHLSRVVRREMGMSVHRWVSDLRLMEAQRLLLNTALPLHRISERVAFKNPAAFSAAFRAAMGLPPSEYRRLAAG